MSERYLLLAEADKIQDFVLFRASTLREVVGASALLTRFCQEAPTDCLGLTKDDIIVSDGGSFRLLFDSFEAAVEAGRELADYYYMATGAQMSVAPPVVWDDTEEGEGEGGKGKGKGEGEGEGEGEKKGFKKANRRAGRLLRSAKRHREPVSTPHMPLVAFCTSAGVDLAARYKKTKPGDSNDNKTYLSRASLYKNRERNRNQGEKSFRQNFARQLEGFSQWGKQPPWPETPEDVGRKGGYDPRDYVAYLVADGNGMGKIFNGCPTPESLRGLSKKLSEIVCESLAAPTNKLMKIHTHSEKEHFIPVLPLILGGDDLFVLLPAPWAISFAQDFCNEFEKRMNDHLKDEADLDPDPEGDRASMAAAVVICKSSFPFYLAHQRGEELLKSAKRLGKYQAAQSRSTVTFEVITGNDSVQPDHDGEGLLYPSLRPYWTSDAKEDKDSIALQSLLNARLKLDAMPQKRRSQLRTLFMDATLQTKPKSEKQLNRLLNEWVGKFEKFLTRLKKLDEPYVSLIDEIMKEFRHRGKTPYWRSIWRGNKIVRANGLPDLLDAWDFLCDLEEEEAK